MFYARSGQIKVDGNNPQGQGIKKRFQSAFVFQARFHAVLEQFSNVLFNRTRKRGYAELVQNMWFFTRFSQVASSSNESVHTSSGVCK